MHGMHNRIFTDHEEMAISSFIRDNYIQPGIVFQNKDFVKLASQSFLESHLDDEDIPDVKFSPKFVWNFKKRNGLSSRRARFKRRNSIDQQEVSDFIKSIQNLINTKPADRILNADETSWRILPSTMTTWAETGADSISINAVDNEKKAITVMATISYAGTKLPLFMVAKGKSKVSEQSQLGDISYHMSAHSSSGWMEQECFEQYLKWLRQMHYDDDPIYLIIDQYPTHKTEQSKTLAQSLNIQLYFIPAGVTDKYQPLDRQVFGCLKNIAKSKIHDFLHEQPGAKIGMKNAVSILIWAWEHINPNVLNQAWDIFNE